MTTDPKKIVAAMNPDIYCLRDVEKFEERTNVREKVKEFISKSFKDYDDIIAKEKKRGLSEEEKKQKSDISRNVSNIYINAVKAVPDMNLVESQAFDFDKVISMPVAEPPPGFRNPIEQHTVSYEVSGQSVEQIYFWLHDYIVNQKTEYGAVYKLVDNFMASPGSNYFSELGMKATKMQEEAMKILGILGQLVKTVLNITYDLKEFKLRIAPYDQLKKAKSKPEKEAAMLSLKQVWLDQVDIKRGNSSIKAMAVSGAQAPNFVMLIDAFMAIESLEKIDAMDLNERVKRILMQRYAEFEKWLLESERELKKRYEIEKLYLRSQYNNIQLYARWVQPYLKAAKALEQKSNDILAPSLVTAFETSVMELVLLGVADYNYLNDVKKGDLPEFLKRKKMRKYRPLCLVELTFRTIPERAQKGYGFRGQAEVKFTSFALHDDEIKILRDQIDKDNFGDLLKLMSGSTEESIDKLKDDVEEFLADAPEYKPLEKEESSEDVNPFTSLFSGFSSLFSSGEKKKEEKLNLAVPRVKPDDDFERIIRSQAILEGRRKCFKLFGTFKKTNNMPSPPS